MISLATTLPEITTSAMASITGSEGIALGNALGSIFANIALILGLASVIRPLEAGSGAYENSLVMLASLGFLMLLSVDGTLSRLDGALLLGAYAYICGGFTGSTSERDAKVELNATPRQRSLTTSCS